MPKDVCYFSEFLTFPLTWPLLSSATFQLECRLHTQFIASLWRICTAHLFAQGEGVTKVL